MGERKNVRLTAFALIFLIPEISAGALTPLSFQFSAPLSADQAPYYLALDKGWYAAQGLDVVFPPANDQATSVASVNGGTADIGTADASTVLAFRAQGMPLTIVATVGDRNPSCVYVLSGGKIGEPRDLAKAKVAVDPADSQRILFPRFAEKIGIRVQDVTFQPMDFPLRINSLAAGSVDAIFSTLEWNRMLRKALGADRLSFFLWADYGFDLYGSCLFVRDDALKSKQAALRGFLSASFKAWEASLANPDQAVAALGRHRVISADEAVSFSATLADLKTLFDTEAYRTKGIGYIDPSRMEATAGAVEALFGVPLGFKPAEAMSVALLPQPPVKMPAEKPAAAGSAAVGIPGGAAPGAGGAAGGTVPAAGAAAGAGSAASGAAGAAPAGSMAAPTGSTSTSSPAPAPKPAGP